MSEFNLAQQLTDKQLELLLTLIKQHPDVSKFDRKNPQYTVDSQAIYLSHSIVKHTDQYGNVFYDVYAKDNDEDGEIQTIVAENDRGQKTALNVSMKKNVIGTGSFGKVKPVIARLYEENGKFIQIQNPELVAKVFKTNIFSSTERLLKAAHEEASELNEHYTSIAISTLRAAKPRLTDGKPNLSQTIDIVMPKLPLDRNKAWHLQHTGDPTNQIILDRLNLVIAMCEAMHEFHVDHNAIIGDFKLENCCYDKQTNIIFLIDLEEKKLTIGNNLVFFKQTDCFTAPEVYKVLSKLKRQQDTGLLFNEKMDIYSLGHNIARVLGITIYCGAVTKPRLPCTEDRSLLSEGIKRLIERLWHKDPNKRPDIKEALQFFSEVRDYYLTRETEERYIVEQKQTKNSQEKMISEEGRLEQLLVEVKDEFIPTQEMGENCKAQYLNSEIYFKKLAFLVTNVEEVIRDIQQQQIRLIHKIDSNFPNDNPIPQNPVDNMSLGDSKKYIVLGKMVKDLEETRKEVQNTVAVLAAEIKKPENQVNLEQANASRQKVRILFKVSTQLAINTISLDREQGYIIEKQTRFAWIRKILRSIASIFSETKGLPASAQALISAGHKLGAIMHASDATIATKMADTSWQDA